MKRHPFIYIRSYGLKLWLIQILILCLNKSNLFNQFKENLVCKKNDLIIKNLSNNYAGLIKKYKNQINPLKKDSNKVWLYWYQGIEDSPIIVKLCYDNMKKFLVDSDIILLTKENIYKYVDIPDFLIKKYENGKISRTHFSDIIRMFVLKAHGGLWLDATILITEEVTQERLKKIKTIKFHCNEKTSISQGMWCVFFLGNFTNTFFSFVCEFFMEYWKKENVIIDYFLFDYIVKIAYLNINAFKKEIDTNQYNNEKVHELCNNLNKRYDKKVFNDILSSNFAHKLSYKIPLTDYNDGCEQTFYYRIKEIYSNEK